MCRLIMYAALAVSAALAGCATPQERAARQQAEMERDMVVYGPACLRLGYAASSDPWRACVLQLATKDELRYNSYPSGYYGAYGPGRWRGGGFWGPYW
jgi:hypothetical protein